MMVIGTVSYIGEDPDYLAVMPEQAQQMVEISFVLWMGEISVFATTARQHAWRAVVAARGSYKPLA